MPIWISTHGWPKSRPMPVNPWLIIHVVLWVSLHTAAVAQDGAGDADKKKTATRAQTAPSLELLEFLGEFETKDGQWVDPAEIEEMELPPQEQRHDK